MIMRILEYCMNNGIKVYTVKDNYELGDNITSKVLAFAFGLSAEIEREMISRRTKEALEKKRQQGIILGRPFGDFNSYTKLSKYESQIDAMLVAGVRKSEIARRFGVDRTTLYRWLKTERFRDRKNSIARANMIEHNRRIREGNYERL